MFESLSSRSIGIVVIFILACVTAAAAGPRSFSDRIEMRGQRREFSVALPDGARSGKPLPTVIALHGLHMPDKVMRDLFGIDEISRREGFAVVYPVGLRLRWNDGQTQSDGPDDVGFVTRLAEHLISEGIADRSRIYLAGVANGGVLAYRVACEAPGVFAAYAAIVANLPLRVAERCSTRGGTPMLIINGTDDRVIPWEGGRLSGFIKRGEMLSTPETVEFWQRHNGCSATAQVKPLPDKDTRDGSTVLARQYPDCNSGAPVVLMTVQGGGHVPPGAQYGNRPWLRLMLGPVNQDISAADVSWKFFKRFPAP